MLARRLIPCLDVKDGLTVKGTCFVNLRAAGDPVALAERYCAEGADELVFLDITATAERHALLTALVSRVAAKINIPFTVGGGITSIAEVEALLAAGADKVSINSAALADPTIIDAISRRFGAQVLVVAIDAQDDDEGQWQCYSHGGRYNTRRDLFAWGHEVQERGAGEILFTSMRHDGTQHGFALSALRALSSSLTIPVIASGGAGTMGDFYDVFHEGNASAALAASVFHYGTINIRTLKEYLQQREIPVRL